jgi:hypothetical protein
VVAHKISSLIQSFPTSDKNFSATVPTYKKYFQTVGTEPAGNEKLSKPKPDPATKL